MSQKNKSSKQKKSDTTPSLASYQAAILIVSVNVVVYFYLGQADWNKDIFKALILYPGNLLQGHCLCILTSGFIHHNWPHLLLNMLGVLAFAGIVEKHLGFVKTLFIYFGALFVSMIFSTVVYAFFLHKNVAIIGASGAVMGLMTTALLLDPFCLTYETILPIPLMFKAWLFLYADIKGFLGGEQDGVSHLAHLFGFLSIGLLVYFLSPKERKLMRTGLIINVASFVFFLWLGRWIIASKG
ncbi:MAG: rhomboid family intramembrane serine protease [Candidatus Omnitrophota bacterium]